MSSYKIIITLQKENQNKLQSLIFNKLNIEELNLNKIN